MKKLIKDLAAIRCEISITKDGVNDYGGYSYYQIEDIYKQAKLLFKKYGLFTTFEQELVSLVNKEQVVNENPVRSSAPVIKSVLTVYSEHTDASLSFSNISEMNKGKGMQAAQNAGANVTYQSKYAYSTLLMLDDGASDPDKTNKKSNKKEPNGGSDWDL